jgi:hypothetical protein
MKKIKYLLTSLFLLPLIAVSQPGYTLSDWVPDRDSLQRSLVIFFELKLEADMEEFRFTEKYRAIKYLPQVGFDMALLRPIVGFNSNLIYQVANDRQARAAKIRGIQKTNKLQREQAAKQLDLLILNLENRLSHYQLWERGRPIREQLKALIRARYKKGEITPSDYLNRELSWQEEERRENDFKYELTRAQIQILEVAQARPQAR